MSALRGPTALAAWPPGPYGRARDFARHLSWVGRSGCERAARSAARPRLAASAEGLPLQPMIATPAWSAPAPAPGAPVAALAAHVRAQLEGPEAAAVADRAVQALSSGASYVVLDTAWLFPPDLVRAAHQAMFDELETGAKLRLQLEETRYVGLPQVKVPPPAHLDLLRSCADWLRDICRRVAFADGLPEGFAERPITSLRASPGELLWATHAHTDPEWLNATMTLLGEGTEILLPVPGTRQGHEGPLWADELLGAVQRTGPGTTVIFSGRHREAAMGLLPSPEAPASGDGPGRAEPRIPAVVHRAPSSPQPRMVVVMFYEVKTAAPRPPPSPPP